MDCFTKRFGQLIDARLAQLNLSREQAAVRVFGDASRKPHISGYINGTKGRPNANTINKFCRGLDIKIDQILALDPSLHLEDLRTRHIEDLCPALEGAPATEWKSIEIEDLVFDATWLSTISAVQTTTVEIEELWSDTNYYRQYEASLWTFKERGLIVQRMFILDEGRLGETNYEMAFARTIHRHGLLGLKPMILARKDARAMHRDMGLKCDALVVLGRKLVLLDYEGSKRPTEPQRHRRLRGLTAFETTNKNVCDLASNVFRKYWPSARNWEVAKNLLQVKFDRKASRDLEDEVSRIKSIGRFYLDSQSR